MLGKDERECLCKSLDTATAAIKECTGTSGGCCVGECSYPSAPTEGETTSSLAGLIDEYRINVQPVALGDGIPLLHGLPDARPLTLVASTAWADGPVTQTYVPREGS